MRPHKCRVVCISQVGAILKKLVSFIRNESGATAIEYGLIAGLIAVVIIGALQLLGSNAALQFNKIAGNIGAA